jgi:glutathione S-transferase
LPIYEKLLNKSESGFFAKSGVTWADFYVSQGFVTMNNLIPDTFTKHPIIKQYVDRVHSLPQLKDYIAKRPVTQF